MSATYVELGFDPTVTVCQCCSKPDLSGTVVLAKTEAGQFDLVRFGRDCAKRALAGHVGAFGVVITRQSDAAWIATWRIPGKRDRRFARINTTTQGLRCSCSTFAVTRACDHVDVVRTLALTNINVAIVA